MAYQTKKFTAAILITLTAFLCVNATAAHIFIDSFDEVDPSVSWPIIMDTVGAAPDVVETGLSTVLGGERVTQLTAVVFGTERLHELQVGIFASQGFLWHSSSFLANGKLDLVYDGGTSGLNADLTGSAWLGIELLAFDPADGESMIVSVVLTDGENDAAVLVQSVDTFGRQELYFPFVKFSEFASLDLTDIDTIAVTFDPGFDADFRVGEIGSVVPEPATLGLLLSGALFGLRRRRH